MVAFEPWPDAKEPDISRKIALVRKNCRYKGLRAEGIEHGICEGQGTPEQCS